MATTTGMKGSDVYTTEGVGNQLVALSTLLVRGVSSTTLTCMVEKVLSQSSDKKMLEDLMVLAFQNRMPRGGKGERDVFRNLYLAFINNVQLKHLALYLLDLVPEYGYWRDLFKLIPEHISSPLGANIIKDIVKKQFLKDEHALYTYSTALANKLLGIDIPKPTISLLAKWLPREGHALATEMACLLVPGTMLYATRMKTYRKKISALNKYLDTVEIKMCAKTWSAIEPSVVPGRASKKYVKAFLNESLSRKGGLRHPADPDRMDCRQHFIDYNAKTASGELKAKGEDTVFPHEIIKKAMVLGANSGESASYDEPERNQVRGVWRAMVEAAKAGGGLGRSLAMCDFSGSMASSGVNKDLPYWVSMAMGLLISEVTTDEFKDMFLTFDSVPTIHRLPDGDLFKRLFSFINTDTTIGHGLSTDFQKAMDLVLQQCKEKRVRPGQEPENLIVLTDMAFDQAYSSSEQSQHTGNSYRHATKTETWQTHVELIRESFKRAGEDMWGEGQGLNMPTLVIWNLAATCQDFHAKADTEGVVMLSGWSPSLFKVLQNKGVVKMTPEAALRIQLDDPLYDKVRQRCQEFFAKELAYFTKEIHQPKLMQNTFTTGSPLW